MWHYMKIPLNTVQIVQVVYSYMWACCLKNAGEISWRIGKKTGEFCRSSICKQMWVNNAKITYHVQRDVHLHFLSPLIKKSNSSIALYTCLFLYPETKHKSYLLWETNLSQQNPENYPQVAIYHYLWIIIMKFYFTEHCQKTFTQIMAFFNLF